MQQALRRSPNTSTGPEAVTAFADNYHYLRTMLRRRGMSGADAEDLAQDVLLVMWRRRGDYDPSRPIRMIEAEMTPDRALVPGERDPRDWPLAFGIGVGVVAAGLLVLLTSRRGKPPLRVKKAGAPAGWRATRFGCPVIPAWTICRQPGDFPTTESRSLATACPRASRSSSLSDAIWGERRWTRQRPSEDRKKRGTTTPSRSPLSALRPPARSLLPPSRPR